MALDRIDTEGRKTVSVEEAGRLIGLGRGAAYAGVKRGEIPSIKVGRRVLVPVAALEKMLAGAPNRSDSATGAAA